jgi:hypothetical protein
VAIAAPTPAELELAADTVWHPVAQWTRIAPDPRFQ